MKTNIHQYQVVRFEFSLLLQPERQPDVQRWRSQREHQPTRQSQRNVPLQHVTLHPVAVRLGRRSHSVVYVLRMAEQRPLRLLQPLHDGQTNARLQKLQCSRTRWVVNLFVLFIISLLLMYCSESNSNAFCILSLLVCATFTHYWGSGTLDAISTGIHPISILHSSLILFQWSPNPVHWAVRPLGIVASSWSPPSVLTY